MDAITINQYPNLLNLGYKSREKNTSLTKPLLTKSTINGTLASFYCDYLSSALVTNDLYTPVAMHSEHSAFIPLHHIRDVTAFPRIEMQHTGGWVHV